MRGRGKEEGREEREETSDGSEIRPYLWKSPGAGSVIALEDDFLPAAASDDDVPDAALGVVDEFELRFGELNGFWGR